MFTQKFRKSSRRKLVPRYASILVGACGLGILLASLPVFAQGPQQFGVMYGTGYAGTTGRRDGLGVGG